MRLFQKLFKQQAQDKAFLNYLKQLLGFAPKDTTLYQLAFLHSSTSLQKGFNNERLEYLGDAVLGLMVAHYLFEYFPQGDEGFLTEMRAKIVSRKQLNAIALELGLDEYIKYQTDPKQEASIPGNALEAVVGALYLDKGYQRTEKFVLEKLIHPYIDIKELQKTELNFKSKLLEWGQKNSKEITFTLLEEGLSDGRPFFSIGVFVNKKEQGRASDFNKKKAEQQAASKAYMKLGLGKESA